MDQVPITFEFRGKQYTGHFARAMGAGGAAVFHLNIDGFYYGQLFYTENYDWQFFGNVEGMEELAMEFGYVVTAWYQ